MRKIFSAIAALAAAGALAAAPGAHAGAAYTHNYVGAGQDAFTDCLGDTVPVATPDQGGSCFNVTGGIPFSFTIADKSGRPQAGVVAYQDAAGNDLGVFQDFCNSHGTFTTPAGAAVAFVELSNGFEQAPVIGTCGLGTQGPATAGTITAYY